MPLLKFWAVKKLSENFPPHPQKNSRLKKTLRKGLIQIMSNRSLRSGKFAASVEKNCKFLPRLLFNSRHRWLLSWSNYYTACKQKRHSFVQTSWIVIFSDATAEKITQN